MTQRYWLSIVALTLLVGCAEHEHADHEETQTTSYYHESEGLKFPDDVRQHLNLKIAPPEQLGSTNHLAVPDHAVIKAADACYVYAERGDYLASVKVEIGTSKNGWTPVLRGLTPTDRVVSRGAMDLRMIELLAIRGGDACCH